MEKRYSSTFKHKERDISKCFVYTIYIIHSDLLSTLALFLAVKMHNVRFFCKKKLYMSMKKKMFTIFMGVIF